jgi:hypothetical protein
MLLNLNRQEDLLTQGQPPAERVLENSGQVSHDETGAGTVQPSSNANNPAPASIDPQVIARRVYELMKQDLLISNERRKPGR